MCVLSTPVRNGLNFLFKFLLVRFSLNLYGQLLPMMELSLHFSSLLQVFTLSAHAQRTFLS